jgi:hypothetical protein
MNPINELAMYLLGAADSNSQQNPVWSEKLKKASNHLKDLADHTCAQGYIGCYGGHKCDSDHK